ncbi:MAG: DMT family transporter [Ruminococcus sp.]|nr:DMT family transporter [Ruminococcus sp.]
MKNKKLLGSLLLTLTALIWGTAFAAQRKGMESIEPITFTAARNVLSAAAVGLAAFIAGLGGRDRGGLADAERRVRRKNTVIGGVCCGCFLASASIFQQMGVVYTTAGKAGFITAMYMLLVPVIGFVFFRRRNPLTVWLAVAVGVLGMYLLCMDGGFRLTRGDALVCVCAVLFSCHILCCDHFARLGDPLWISAIQFLTTMVISGAAAFIMERPTWTKIASAAVPILYCGIVSGGIGYTLQMVAQRFTDPTVASLLMSLESVFAVIAGALLLGERMSGRELVGCAVMFAAIVLVQLPERKKQE